MFKFAIAALVLVDAMLIASPAGANTLDTWTDNAGGEAWETPGNWDLNQVPNNNTFDVRFSTSAAPTCNLSSQFQIGSLLLVSGVTLNLQPGSLLAIDSSNGVNNSGTIVVNTTAANSATTLRFDTSATISGSGNIQLNGINPGNAMISADGVTVTNGLNHTIHGRGDISMTANNAVLVNNGTINADQSGDSLRISLSNALGNQNNGTIKSSNRGVLFFEQGFLDQSGGGMIVGGLPPFGNVPPVSLGDSTHTPTFLGGTFAASDYIKVNNATFNGCTNLAYIILPGVLTILGNDFTNNGFIGVGGTIRFNANVVINGTGQIAVGGTFFGDGVTVTNGASHQITGNGDISLVANNAVLVNNGTIRATGETLRIFLSNAAGNQNNSLIKAVVDPGQGPAVLSFEQGKIDQSGGGTLSAIGTPSGIGGFGSNNTLKIGGAQAATVIGGTLDTRIVNSYQGIIQGIAAVLAGDITNLGAFEIPANDFTHVTATTLTNNGTMTLDASTSLLRFDASTLVAGSGAIILTNNAIMEINNNASNTVINGASHTIRGNGTLQIDTGATLTNNGAFAPGNSAGRLNFSGNLQLGSTSNLLFEIGGINQGTDYDLLHKVDSGTLTLNGKLTVTLINGFTPASTDTFFIITTQSALAGAFNNVATGARLNTSDGSGSFLVTYTGDNVVLSNFGAAIPTPTPTPTPTPSPTPANLLNISTRLRVLTGDNVGIGGFIVTGSDPKKVIVRGIGPSLTSQGVPDALRDPTLELHDGSGALIASNDNWKDTQQSEIEATGIAPSNDLESAIVATLPANNSAYTAILRGNNDTTGIGLVEAYDLDQLANSKLANISTRGFVDTGDNVLIGGLILGGGGGGNAKIVVRAIGPSLANSGVSDALQDPILELHDGNGALIAVDDNWKDSQQADIQATGIPPTDDRESAIVALLAPGSYTAIVRGVNDTTGVALVEVYDLQ
jgi:hypothetical protein